MHVGDRARIDAVIRAQRAQHGIQPPVLGGLFDRRAGHDLRCPQLAGAGAVFVPAFHRTAQARPGVGGRIAGEFVIAARHGIQHEGRYAALRGLAPRRVQQVVDHAGQREAGAGIGAALIEHGEVDPGFERRAGDNCDGRLVRAVAQVDPVGDDVALQAGEVRSHGCVLPFSQRMATWCGLVERSKEKAGGLRSCGSPFPSSVKAASACVYILGSPAGRLAQV